MVLRFVTVLKNERTGRMRTRKGGGPSPGAPDGANKDLIELFSRPAIPQVAGRPRTRKGGGLSLKAPEKMGQTRT